MAWNLTCWCILTTSELIRFWSSSVHFPRFGIILTLWNRPDLQLLDIFWRTHWRNGLNFGMLMYPDHLQNLLNFVLGLLIFLFLASFWSRSNLGSLAIFFRMHGRNGLQFDMLMYPDYLFSCLHFGHGLWIFLILAGILLSETSQICRFQAFSWECIGGIGRTNLVLSKEMEMANFSIRKLSSHPWLLCSQTFLVWIWGEKLTRTIFVVRIWCYIRQWARDGGY